jgi:Zn-finger protein
MFHKVQSSFVENFSEIEKKELTAANCSFRYGPYYPATENPTNNRWSLETLMDNAEKLSKNEESRAIKNHLREWLTLLIHNPGRAEQYMNRVKSMTGETWNTFLNNNLYRKDGDTYYTPIYDLLSIISIQSNAKEKVTQPSNKIENEHTN